jgi:hypothetical protein
MIIKTESASYPYILDDEMTYSMLRRQQEYALENLFFNMLDMLK